ncbi:hypothetical protein PJN38_23675 [Mycobacterium kansasii]
MLRSVTTAVRLSNAPTSRCPPATAPANGRAPTKRITPARPTCGSIPYPTRTTSLNAPGAIAPGDQYIADTASERRYCLRCGFMRAATIESPSA